jgi:hypothetical protein
MNTIAQGASKVATAVVFTAEIGVGVGLGEGDGLGDGLAVGGATTPPPSLPLPPLQAASANSGALTVQRRRLTVPALA